MPARENEDSISSGFEPETPSSLEPSMPSANLNTSFDSLETYNAEQNAASRDSALDEIPLIQDLPHNSYNPSGTNTLYTVILIVNAALGAGLLNFPKAFEQAGGIAVAVTVQLILLAFIISSLNILAYSADRNSSGPASTIEDVMGQSVGRFGRILTSLCVVVYCFGVTVTFLIMIGDQFDRLFSSLIGPDYCLKFYLNRDFTMSITGIAIILPLCFSKKIDFLRIPSMVGVIAVFYLMALICYEYFGGHFVPGEIKYRPDKWTDVFLVVPDICFGYQCHVSVIPIYSCMKHRNLKSFSIVSVSAISVCALAYTVSAAFGYLTFGSKIDADILLSFPADKSHPEVIIGIIAMALKTISTYPILLFCGREALKNVIKDVRNMLGQEINEQEDNITLRVVIVLVWFALSILCAVLVPNIGEAISFLGCLAAYFIFCIPGVCLIAIILKSDPSLIRNKNKMLLVVGGLYVVVGAFIFGVVLVQDIQTVEKTVTSGYLRYYFKLSKMSCTVS